jgi:hypothetical protein
MLSRQLDKKTRVQVGLRGEQNDNRGLDSVGNRLSGQDYLNIFPTFVIGRRISASHFFSLGYSRRINRPSPAIFNTFRSFSSTLSYFQGNPSVLPALYNSFTLADLVKNRYFVELSYINVKRFSTGVFDVDSTLIPGQNRIRNSIEYVGGTVSWWNLKVLLPLDITKWWAFNGQIWSGINVYNYQRKDTRVDTTQFYWGASIQQNFTLSGTLSLQIGGWVNSGQTSGFKTSRPSGALDIGFRKLIRQKNGSLKISLQDPFNLNHSRTVTSTSYFGDNGVYRWNNRMLIVGFTYSFGNRNINVNKWQSKYRENNADEKN